MKSLTDIYPDPKKVLELGPEKLGKRVLECLSDTDEPNIERAIICKTLSSGYHQSFQKDIAQAIEDAIDWLIAQCLAGSDPYNLDLIALTRPSKKVAADYRAELDAEIT